MAELFDENSGLPGLTELLQNTGGEFDDSSNKLNTDELDEHIPVEEQMRGFSEIEKGNIANSLSKHGVVKLF